MKKSMLMLVALFMLGACSTDEGVNSGWKDAVGGKYVYDTSDEGSELMGQFSADASELYGVDEESGEIDKENVAKIHDGSTASSATYSVTESVDMGDDGKFDVTVTVKFSNLSNGEGDYVASMVFGDIEESNEGTFLVSAAPIVNE